MNELPKKRRSIHADEKVNSDKKTDEKLLLCEDSQSTFPVSEDGTETPFLETQDEKGDYGDEGVDAKLSTPTKFKSESGKPPVVTEHAGLKKVIFTKWIIVAIVVVVVGIFWNFDSVMYFITRNRNIEIKNEKTSKADIQMEKELDNLETMYKNQIEDTWITFIAGIKSVVRKNPNKPSMFLMLFETESAGNTAKCIAQAVSKHAIYYLMNKSGTPMIVDGAKLNNTSLLDDPGLLLTLIKTPVQEKGALVVINLHEVPAQVAKMFHFVCDAHSPLVEKAVTFFTLKVGAMPSLKGLQREVQRIMNDLWKSVLKDVELKALITRMTTNIVRIYPESDCYGI